MTNVFKPEDAPAKVVSVDSGTVTVKVLTPENMQKFAVNKLVAIDGAMGQYLIGIVSRLTRMKDSCEDENDEGFESLSSQDVIRISLVGTYHEKDGEQVNVFKRTLENIPKIDALCWPIEGQPLSVLMRSISNAGVKEDKPLELGTYSIDGMAKAYLNGNRLFQKHAVVVGSTGSGKSWATALLLEQIAALNNSSALVFDLHGEYSNIKGKNFYQLKIAGPGDLSKTLRDNILFLPYWLLPYDALIKMFVDRSDNNAPNQAAKTASLVRKYKLEFIKENKFAGYEQSFTVDSPVYFDINKLLGELKRLDVEMVSGEKGREKQGPFHGKLTRFITRLDTKMTDNRLGFMFQGTDEVRQMDYLNKLADVLLGKTLPGVKIIDFSEVPSDVLPLMVAMVARIVFTLQVWLPKEKRFPISLFCDEAHNYIPNSIDADSSLGMAVEIFEKIAKEGRKFGVGLFVISQRPSEVSKTVLSQCSNFLAMRLSNVEDQNVIKRLLPDNLTGAMSILPILDVGEALVVGDACLLPSRIRVNEPRNKPSSNTLDFWTEWHQEKREVYVDEAVENWRKQCIK